MSKTMFDLATQLLPAAAYASTTNGTPLQIEPRFLATTGWHVSVTSPPAGAVTLTLAVAATSGGAYTTVAILIWPAGTTGSRQVSVGTNAPVASVLLNTARWVRASVTISADSITCSSWLAPLTDGVGLGSRAGNQVEVL